MTTTQKPTYWARADGMKAMSDDEKQGWIESGNRDIADDYSVPLYSAPTEAAAMAATVPASSDVLLTAEDVAQAREMLHRCSASAILSGSNAEARKSFSDREIVYRLITEANTMLIGDFPPQAPVAGQPAEPSPMPTVCDGIEQDAFEAWAQKNRYDMAQHPLLWLFLNDRTWAARDGWKAGIEHAMERLAAPKGDSNG